MDHWQPTHKPVEMTSTSSEHVLQCVTIVCVQRVKFTLCSLNLHFSMVKRSIMQKIKFKLQQTTFKHISPSQCLEPKASTCPEQLRAHLPFHLHLLLNNSCTEQSAKASNEATAQDIFSWPSAAPKASPRLCCTAALPRSCKHLEKEGLGP